MAAMMASPSRHLRADPHGADLIASFRYPYDRQNNKLSKRRVGQPDASEAAPKGEGRLILRIRPSGMKEVYYRYRAGGQAFKDCTFTTCVMLSDRGWPKLAYL
ncbi:MAG: hypothetical protein HY650_12115 [Acidobacteria bacterium]|nr:hypothetical protein [Acidobacteriota bacterium]